MIAPCSLLFYPESMAMLLCALSVQKIIDSLVLSVPTTF